MEQNERLTTNWYACTKCGLPCDVMVIGVAGGEDNGMVSLCCDAPVAVANPAPARPAAKEKE